MLFFPLLPRQLSATVYLLPYNKTMLLLVLRCHLFMDYIFLQALITRITLMIQHPYYFRSLIPDRL